MGNIRIAFAGTGKACRTLLPAVKAAGHEVTGVWGRDTSKSEALAGEFGISCIEDAASFADADLLILAVIDEAIAEVNNVFADFEGIKAHLSGTQSLAVLGEGQSTVLWPIQTLNPTVTNLKSVPFCYECGGGANEQIIRDLVQSLGAQPVATTQEERNKLHLCAVLTNNFSNFLFTMSHRIVGQEKAHLLIPIMTQMVEQWRVEHPENLQTGPAKRNDEITMKRNRDNLEGYPEYQELYDQFSSLIKAHYE